MRQPDIWTVGTLKTYPNGELVQTPDGVQYWRPARPEPHNAFSFRWRWKLAWKVLTGRYDAVRWEQ